MDGRRGRETMAGDNLIALICSLIRLCRRGGLALFWAVQVVAEVMLATASAVGAGLRS